MVFEFYRFRFHFAAAGTLYFPPYKSGNIVRGAFGSIFRELVCRPGCNDAKTCDARSTCAYARIFEPRAARGEGPSGLADWPRPFVFRAAHLDGRTIHPGERFHFDVHSFDVRDPALQHFTAAFSQLASHGLGPGRGRAEFISVDRLDLDGAATAGGQDAAPIRVELSTPETARGVELRFVTPTELKAGSEPAPRPEFGILLSRLRDRISTLRELYGDGPLKIDFRAMGERAAAVRLTRWELTHVGAHRLSSRTGQSHALGGFVGAAEYEGDLGEFLPYLRLGEWVGVGRQTVWGKGELRVESSRP